MKRRNAAWMVVTLVVVTGIAVYMVSTLRRAGEPSSTNEPSHADSAAADDIAYYTCTMHPSVKSHEPGKCPICSMDLVPVRETAQPDTAGVDLTFSVSPVKQQLIGVNFAEAERRDVHKLIRAYGRVDYDETAVSVVNLRVGGWIERLFVDFTGKFVHKGEPLFTLYSPDLVSAQSEYLLALKAADTTGESYASDLLATARERLRLWQLTDAQVRALEQRGQPETNVTIASPASGFVVDKMALQGMRVEPEMELYRIADLSRVWVHAEVYEHELSLIRVGQDATVSFPTAPGREFQGRISYVYPTLDPETRTARVRIALPNRDGSLKPDMYAEVGLHVDLGERLVVPEGAVLRTGERQIVFVDKGDGILELRLVKLGVHGEDDYEITEGLDAGERVVATANFLVDAESKVQGVLRRLEGETAAQPAPVHKH